MQLLTFTLIIIVPYLRSTVTQWTVLINLHLFVLSAMEDASHVLAAVKDAMVKTITAADKVVHKNIPNI